MDRVLGFRPSRDGFRFGNSWPHGAPVKLAGLPLGRVRGGLCGGMAYAAREAWLAGRPVPTDRVPPGGGPLADQLWRAQLASLDLPVGPLRYLWFQLPPGERRRRRLTLTKGLPRLGASLATGRPALLGLVRAVSWDPRLLVEHHVVLGYGLRDTAAGAEVHIYDPNHPGDDSVRLLVTPDGTVTHTGDGTVAAFTVVGRPAGRVAGAGSAGGVTRAGSAGGVTRAGSAGGVTRAGSAGGGPPAART
ncbi:MAG: hypothetical protein ACJ73E_13865 [Mycobacteriales bacterium]